MFGLLIMEEHAGVLAIVESITLLMTVLQASDASHIDEAIDVATKFASMKLR